MNHGAEQANIGIRHQAITYRLDRIIELLTALAASPAPDPGADVERDAAGEPVRFWWCPGWQTLNATRYHGVGSPDVKGCGEVSYYRAASSAEPPETP